MARRLVTKLSISKLQIKVVDAHLERVRQTMKVDIHPTIFTTPSPVYFVDYILIYYSDNHLIAPDTGESAICLSMI